MFGVSKEMIAGDNTCGQIDRKYILFFGSEVVEYSWTGYCGPVDQIHQARFPLLFDLAHATTLVMSYVAFPLRDGDSTFHLQSLGLYVASPLRDEGFDASFGLQILANDYLF